MGPLFSLLTQQQLISISLRWLAHSLAKAGTGAQSGTPTFTHCLLESTAIADTRKPASDPSNNVDTCSIGRQLLSGTQLPGQRLGVERPLDRWSPDDYVPARTLTAQSRCKNLILRTHTQFILDSLSEIGLEIAHIHGAPGKHHCLSLTLSRLLL